MTRFVAISTCAYSCLLRLCAGELRREFGEEMTLVFAEDLAESCSRGGLRAALGVCLQAAGELAALAVPNALSLHGVRTSLIASALTTICFSAELLAARAHGPTRVSTAPAYVSVFLVLIPSAAAACIGFLVTRSAARNTPQRFLN